jgi:hypothetical protein
MKIVINEDYGGFGVSYDGMLRYALLKGVELYPEKGRGDYWTYWTVPEGQRPKDTDASEWRKWSEEQRIAYNAQYDNVSMSDRDIPRNDPALVQTVEELGKQAMDKYACLKVVDIPEGIDWVIEEYDGKEWVAEAHQTWE